MIVLNKKLNVLQIQKAYERINVNYNKSSHLKQIFSRGLMLDNDNFNAVHDGDFLFSKYDSVFALSNILSSFLR